MILMNAWVWLILTIVFGVLASWAKMRSDLNRSVRMNRPLLFWSNALTFLTVVSLLMLVLSVSDRWLQA